MDAIGKVPKLAHNKLIVPAIMLHGFVVTRRKQIVYLTLINGGRLNAVSPTTSTLAESVLIL